MGQVGDFLLHLFHDKGLSVSTIKGYRSALSSSLRFSHHTAKDIGSDPRISDMVSFFARHRPTCQSVTPRWDLTCVLLSLTRAPFEPMDQASLMDWSVKTAFLLAFASAKRRGELHALSIDHRNLKVSDDAITFCMEAGFLPKTAVPGLAPLPFVVPALSKANSTSATDVLLCPVRAVKHYLFLTQPLRGIV